MQKSWTSAAGSAPRRRHATSSLVACPLCARVVAAEAMASDRRRVRRCGGTASGEAAAGASSGRVGGPRGLASRSRAPHTLRWADRRVCGQAILRASVDGVDGVRGVRGVRERARHAPAPA
eukprot:689027-Prymnesium_polylepis.1